MRAARDAEAVHLEALLRVNGAKYLRLSHLRNALNEAYPKQVLELKAEQGEEPVLWLDFSHHVTMQPDNKTYRLSYMNGEALERLLQTTDFKAALEASKNVLDHAILRARWAEGNAALPGQPPTAWPYSTLVYVWLTGLVSGGAALALASIYLKNIDFLGTVYRYIW